MSTLSKIGGKIARFWKREDIKDRIHERADKLLGQYETTIHIAILGAVTEMNAHIAAELERREVPAAIIAVALIPPEKAQKISAKLIKELEKTIDQLW